MGKVYAIAALLLCTVLPSLANNFSSPGTGVKWTLTDLVSNAGGDVTFSGGEYFVNDTVFIAQNDTLSITSNAVVRFIANSYLDINGTLIINPPTGVTFTAQNASTGFLGMRVDSSNTTVLRKLTFEYANSLRLFDCTIKIDSCIFRYNSPSTSWGNGAISLNRANPIITYCQFLNNQRSAIQSGSNINNAPKIMNCLFMGNNTLNTNVPQINLGATSNGSDTVKIINNQILRASTNSGGIGFLPIGNVYAIINGNTIRNNRYGITFSGGSGINAIVSYNIIDSNNTQNDPNLGGSGISFTGGSATSHQNTIVTGNTFRANLWGITIQNFAKPNLGDLTNTDTTDNGKNLFINNTNATTPGTDLYNNSPDPIMAQNNYWNTVTASVIETKIFHQADNSALGLVNYTPFSDGLLLISLKSFVVTPNGNDVLLTWQTSLETNTDFFGIEKSRDGQQFHEIGRVGSNGSAAAYHYTDINGIMNETNVFYRLKMLDKDGRFSYSPILSINRAINIKTGMVKLYPTMATSSQTFTAIISSSQEQRFTLQFINAAGQVLDKVTGQLAKGRNMLSVAPTKPLPTGQVFLVFKGEDFGQTIPVMVN